MNINARLDHLLDKFKHDLRDLMDSARAEERSGIMNRLESFLDKDETISEPAVLPKFASGGYVGKTLPTVSINVPAGAKAEDVSKAIIEQIPTQSKRTCIICSDSIEGTHKRRKICTKESCRKQYVNDYQKKIKERQAEGIKARKADTSRPIETLPDDTPPESNRPLIEFLGTKKKRPFLCEFCNKPCDDRYCSSHCESEDKRLSSLNKGKSYSDYLNEKGMKAPAVPEL